jgi:hypothetical protein
MRQRRDRYSATCNPEVKRLQQVSFGFQQNIPTHNSTVRNPMLDIDRHI